MYLVLVTLLFPLSTLALNCFSCWTLPTEKECVSSNTCSGKACFIITDSATDNYYLGCSEETLAKPAGSCFTSGSKELCACADKDQCNKLGGTPFDKVRIPFLTRTLDIDTFLDELNKTTTTTTTTVTPATDEGTKSTTEEHSTLSEAEDSNSTSTTTTVSTESSPDSSTDSSTSTSTEVPTTTKSSPFSLSLVSLLLFILVALF